MDEKKVRLRTEISSEEATGNGETETVGEQ
jgi:hypothetical protein